MRKPFIYLTLVMLLVANVPLHAQDCQSGEYRTPKLDKAIQKQINKSRYGGACIEALTSDADEYEEIWYRDLRFDAWESQGIDRRTIDLTLAKVIAGDAKEDVGHFSSSEDKLDTFSHDESRNGAWLKQWRNNADSEYARAQKVPLHLRRKALLRAAILYNIASYPHLAGDWQAREAYLMANQSYREAGEHFDTPLQVLNIPVSNPEGEIPVYLHMPSDAPSPVSVVLLSAGSDVTMVEHYGFVEELNARGMAAVTYDAPGIGNSEDWPYWADQTWLLQEIISHIQENAVSLDIDANRIGLLSMSLNGNAGVRMAIEAGSDSPVQAVVDMCGATGSVFSFPLTAFAFGFPRMTIEAVASSMGFDYRDFVAGDVGGHAPLRSKLLSFSLYEQGYLEKWFEEDEEGFAGPLDTIPGQPVLTDIPILSINTLSDTISTPFDMQAVSSVSSKGEIRAFPEYEGHCAPRSITAPYSAWWLQQYLEPELED